MRLLFIPATVIMSGCMQVTPIAEAQRVPIDAGLMADIQADVTRDFFDPASAQFRNVRAVDVVLENGSNERRVCGEVNGKNRLGGYTGFEMFGGTVTNGDFQQKDFFSACEAW